MLPRLAMPAPSRVLASRSSRLHQSAGGLHLPFLAPALVRWSSSESPPSTSSGTLPFLPFKGRRPRFRQSESSDPPPPGANSSETPSSPSTRTAIPSTVVDSKRAVASPPGPPLSNPDRSKRKRIFSTLLQRTDPQLGLSLIFIFLPCFTDLRYIVPHLRALGVEEEDADPSSTSEVGTVASEQAGGSGSNSGSHSDSQVITSLPKLTYRQSRQKILSLLYIARYPTRGRDLVPLQLVVTSSYSTRLKSRLSKLNILHSDSYDPSRAFPTLPNGPQESLGALDEEDIDKNGGAVPSKEYTFLRNKFILRCSIMIRQNGDPRVVRFFGDWMQEHGLTEGLDKRPSGQRGGFNSIV